MIEFNTLMRDSADGVNISHINATVLNVTLALNREQLALSKEPADKLQNLTWNATLFLGSQLVIQCSFDSPLLIGQSKHLDFIKVEVLDKTFFRDKTGTRQLSNSSIHMSKNMPKQLLNDVPSEILRIRKETIQNSLDAAAVTTILMNLLFSLGISTFLEMINSLQIISYQQILDLEYPANLEYLTGVIVRVLNAKIIAPDWSSSLAIDSSYVETSRAEGHETFLTDSLYTTGFETFSPVSNIGGLFIFLAIVAAEIVVLGVSFLGVKAFRACATRSSHEGGELKKMAKRFFRKKFLLRAVKRQLNSVFFAHLIIILMESYLQMVISCVLFLNLPWDLEESLTTSHPQGYKFNYVFSVGMLTLCVLVLPLLALLTLVLPRGFVSKGWWRKRFGELTRTVRSKPRANRAMALVFFIRRIILVLVTVLLRYGSGMELLTLSYVNLFT